MPWDKSAAAQGGQETHYKAFIAALMARQPSKLFYRLIARLTISKN
jgi:hypothetical protein